MTSTSPFKEILEVAEWSERCADHLAAAREFTAGPRSRRDRGEKHPVEDFLFDYYPYPLALLESWHPWIDTALVIGDAEFFPARFGRKGYRTDGEICFLDPKLISEKEAGRLEWIRELLVATQAHAAIFACHGMHEWAMVYRAEEIRHAGLAPLRLSQAEIDTLVESRSIVCTHHDAFRFFANDARPYNKVQPTLETRHINEQPGCVHANMDLYKWAAKAMPWSGSDLLLDCFRLANRLRDLDMRASPYDLSTWGVMPVKIETVEGRREYETTQRELAGQAGILRARLITRITAVLGKAPTDLAIPASA